MVVLRSTKYVGHMDGFGGYEGTTRSKLQQSAIFARPSMHSLILSGKSLEEEELIIVDTVRRFSKVELIR